MKGPVGGGVVSDDEAEDRKREASEAPKRSWKKERLFMDLLSRLPIEAKAFHRGFPDRTIKDNRPY